MTSSISTNEAEQILVSCCNPSDDNCEDGGYSYDASDYIQNTGLPPHQYYPYTGTDGKCADAVSGWQSQTYDVSSWWYVTSASPTKDALRSALYSDGPLAVWMEIYEDFYNYTEGIYTHVSGNQVGGHFVELIGYDDTDQCFIAKTSWGTDWGESEPGAIKTRGFFRIAYSEVTGDSEFGSYAIAYSPGNQPPPTTRFTVSAPSSATAGTPFNFTVTAIDSNSLTGYSGTVHFKSTDSAAALPANYTLTKGKGTFSATLNTAGNQTITATDTVYGSVTGTSKAVKVVTLAIYPGL
jgi:hypothetical protein